MNLVVPGHVLENLQKLLQNQHLMQQNVIIMMIVIVLRIGIVIVIVIVVMSIDQDIKSSFFVLNSFGFFFLNLLVSLVFTHITQIWVE